MLKKLSIVDLISAIQKKVEEKTGLRCYDDANNKPSPFYLVEFVNKRDASSKTMFCDIFSVFLHAIASPNVGSVEIYKMITTLEEAMTEDIELPDGYTVITQTETGVNNVQTDESGEKHAVLLFEFKICYGYKIKE